MGSAWQFNETTTAPNVRTASSSPDSQPLQSICLDSLSLENNNQNLLGRSEELVGMGLYDSPAEVQSSSVLFDGAWGTGKKALKLAESFVPSEQHDNVEEGPDGNEQVRPDVKEEAVDEKWQPSTMAEYEPHSIASHMAYDFEPRPEPLATTYLTTLRQMNSIYYPLHYPEYGQGCGWI